MCAEYDSSRIYRTLKEFLIEESSVLELGSGPDSDKPFLCSLFKLTASDLSDEFIFRLKNKLPDIPVLKIDALNITLMK